MFWFGYWLVVGYIFFVIILYGFYRLKQRRLGVEYDYFYSFFFVSSIGFFIIMLLMTPFVSRETAGYYMNGFAVMLTVWEIVTLWVFHNTSKKLRGR